MDCSKDNARRLTFLGLNVLNPSFSPDGRRIAFSAGGKRDIFHHYHIYIINVDGTGLQRLTDEPGPNFGNCVSPDGIKLVYISDPTGEDDNYFTTVPQVCMLLANDDGFAVFFL
jgi:TolB protein